MPEVLSIEVDEEFDPRPPAQPFGLKDPNGNWNIGLLAGIVVAIILIIALIVVIVNPFGEEKAKEVVAWSPNNPLKNIEALPTYSNNDPIVQDLQSALDDWALFYTSGDINILDNSFDKAGNQYALLLNGRPASESSPAIKSAAEIMAETALLENAIEPAVIEIGVVGNAWKKGNLFLLRTQLVWTEPGGSPSKYNWDITMKKSSNANNFVLSTIITTDASSLNGLDFCGAAKVLNKLDTDEQVNKGLARIGVNEQAKAVDNLINIRLATWKYVAPAFLKSATPDSPYTIIEQYEIAKKTFKESKTLNEFNDKIKEVNETIKFVNAHEEAVEAAQSECDIDISMR
jgi:hypothetical protein